MPAARPSRPRPSPPSSSPPAPSPPAPSPPSPKSPSSSTRSSRSAAALRPGHDPARTLAVAARVLERSLDDMTLPQFRILSLVAASPERAGQIASRAAVSRPSLTGILDGLVKRGWVRRIHGGDDRRGVTLKITPAGRLALDDASRAVNGRLEVILATVDADERQRARDGLAALGHALERHLTRPRGDDRTQGSPAEARA